MSEQVEKNPKKYENISFGKGSQDLSVAEDPHRYCAYRGQEMFLSKMAKFSIFDHKHAMTAYKQQLHRKQVKPHPSQNNKTIREYEQTMHKIKRQKLIDQLATHPFKF